MDQTTPPGNGISFENAAAPRGVSDFSQHIPLLHRLRCLRRAGICGHWREDDDLLTRIRYSYQLVSTIYLILHSRSKSRFCRSKP
ncbi:hypothetical protein FOXYS1_12882, partial [Fusarium oxysporum]